MVFYKTHLKQYKMYEAQIFKNHYKQNSAWYIWFFFRRTVFDNAIILDFIFHILPVNINWLYVLEQTRGQWAHQSNSILYMYHSISVLFVFSLYISLFVKARIVILQFCSIVALENFTLNIFPYISQLNFEPLLGLDKKN